MMIQPIPRYFRLQLHRHDRLVKPLDAAISSALTSGALKPGDQIASPQELAHRYHLSPVEVLESISRLLSRGILRQNHKGDLFINSVNGAHPQLPGQQQVA